MEKQNEYANDKESDGISEVEQCQVSIEIDPDAIEDFGDISATASFAPPEPPEIPLFLDNVRIEQMTPEIQRRLNLTLDLPTTTHALKNWEWLASQLGMPAEEITYLRERVLYPESPTREVLRRYGRESFGRLLRIIRDSLQRYDVIIQLLPALTAFEEYLSSKPVESVAAAASAYAVSSKKGATVSNVDSGIISSVQTTNRGLSGSLDQSTSGINNNGRPMILVTFAEDSPQHKKLVLWLCKNLENSNAHVILDNSLASTAAEDWTAQVSECFSKAKAVVVVCSPAYIRCIDTPSTDENLAMVDSHSQCSRLIYQLMCSEYRQLNCRNRRFRPIIFDTTPVGVDVVPPILRNTVIHRWPAQHNEFMKLIFGDSRVPS